MRGALHRFYDIALEKALEVVIPILVKINATPNQITVLRLLLLIPPAMFLLTLNNYLGNIVALVLFHVFIFLDHVDGKIAYVRNMYTKTGEIIDPIVDYVGHILIFIGIILGVLSSGGIFQLGFGTIKIPAQLLLICGLLTIVGYSVTIIFSLPTPFFMFKDLHDFVNLHLMSERNRCKLDNEPTKVWLCKNIIGYHHFPFNIIFKTGTLLTICVLLNVLFIPLIIFSITLNIRSATLFYYFFKIYEKKKI